MLSELMTAAPPAGGAETTQVIGVTAAATVFTAALLFYGHGPPTGRTRALQPVHIFGYPPDIQALERHRLPRLEYPAEALGPRGSGTRRST